MDEGFIQDFLANGFKLLEIGHFEDVRDLCEELLEKVRDERVYSLLASAHFALGDNEAAEIATREGVAQAQAHGGESFDNLFNLACIMKETNRYSNAWRFFNRAERYAEEGLKAVCAEEKANLEQLLGMDAATLCPPKQNKRVLVIAAIYPPESGSGVQRTLKLVKYMRLFGWEPVVVTVLVEGEPRFSGAEYLDELPEDIEVIRVSPNIKLDNHVLEKVKNMLTPMLSYGLRKDFEQLYASADFKGKVKLCSFPEDAIFWAYDVINNIDKYVDMDDIDLVFSTSEPYADHLAGYYIKERFKKPWVADFREEWSHNPSMWDDKTGMAYRMCVDCERVILEAADQVIAILEAAYDNYVKMKVSKSKLITITNGYDEEDFEGLDIAENSDRFTLVSNGLPYQNISPEDIIEAIAGLVNKGAVNRDKIIFYISYFTDDAAMNAVVERIAALGLEDVVKITPYMEHIKSLKFTAAAHMLVLILAKGTYRGAFDEKVFEYLHLCKPVLCVGVTDSITAKTLRETKAGVTYEYGDIPGIEDEILAEYNDWLAGKPSATTFSEQIRAYERRNLTKKHTEAFARAVAMGKQKSRSEASKKGHPKMDTFAKLLYDNRWQEAFQQIMNTIYMQYDYKKASKYLEAYLDIAESGTVHLFYGVCLNALGRFDEAIRAHKRALKMDALLANIKSKDHTNESLIYDEAETPCIGCGSLSAQVVWVCNQSFTANNYGIINPLRIWKKCDVCGLTYAGNLPSQEAMDDYNKRVLTEAQESRKAHTHSETIDINGYLRNSNERLGRIESLTGSKGRILDIGAGNGAFVHAATERGWSALGVESSPDNCQYAKKTFNIDLLQIDFYDYHPDEAFDVITMFEVIEHLKSPWEALQKCASALKKDGVLIIATPFQDSKFTTSKPAAEDVWWNEPAHLSYLDTRSLMDNAGRCGLEGVSVINPEQGKGRLEVYLKKR